MTAARIRAIEKILVAINEKLITGKKDVGNSSGVFFPVSFVFLTATDFVSRLAMQYHAGEKERIEVGQWAIEPTGETPASSHDNVSRILHLSGILVPAVNQEISMRSSHDSWTRWKDTPRNLEKRLATTEF